MALEAPRCCFQSETACQNPNWGRARWSEPVVAVGADWECRVVPGAKELGPGSGPDPGFEEEALEARVPSNPP